jgi:hypothetical protein
VPARRVVCLWGQTGDSRPYACQGTPVAPSVKYCANCFRILLPQQCAGHSPQYAWARRLPMGPGGAQAPRPSANQSRFSFFVCPLSSSAPKFGSTALICKPPVLWRAVVPTPARHHSGWYSVGQDGAQARAPRPPEPPLAFEALQSGAAADRGPSSTEGEPEEGVVVSGIDDDSEAAWGESSLAPAGVPCDDQAPLVTAKGGRFAAGASDVLP